MRAGCASFGLRYIFIFYQYLDMLDQISICIMSKKLLYASFVLFVASTVE